MKLDIQEYTVARTQSKEIPSSELARFDWKIMLLKMTYSMMGTFYGLALGYTYTSYSALFYPLLKAGVVLVLLLFLSHMNNNK